jgi:cysteine synthase A
MIYENVSELIGNTPLVKLNSYSQEYHCNIYAKLEKFNFSGSVKDRACLAILQDYLNRGIVTQDTTIIEASSGNTGIALSGLCAYYHLKCVIVMPSSMSLQRRNLIQAYQAELVLVEGTMEECVKKANEIKDATPNSIIFGQFDNENNLNAHYLTTAREIHQDLSSIDAIVAGIGSSGTICGIGKYFKEIKEKTIIVGVEPLSSPLISQGKAGKHKIQGIGPNFVPSIFNKDYIDELTLISDDEALNEQKNLVTREGILVGISSGCNLKAALNYITTHPNVHNIVVIFPDGGERYL